MHSVHRRLCVGNQPRYNCTSVNYALAPCVAMSKLIPSNLQIAQLAVLPYWISKHTVTTEDKVPHYKQDHGQVLWLHGLHSTAVKLHLKLHRLC